MFKATYVNILAGSTYTAITDAGTIAANVTVDIENCIVENSGVSALQISGLLSTLKNCSVWGSGSGRSGIVISSSINASNISGNIVNNCTYGLSFIGNSIGNIINTMTFGNIKANTIDIAVSDVPYIAAEIVTPNGFSTISSFAATVPGTLLRIDNVTATNDDRTYGTYGMTQRTGTGLTDTTVHTAGAGKFAIRLQPTSSVNAFSDWSFTIPTGDITGRLMTIACWCKINAATYYAGVHTSPTMSINYDNGTIATAVATDSTDWQLLAVNFTPATAYGQVTVTISGMTDALTTDAYFYIDDFAVLYPAGYKLDLGGLDLWANALPVVPPIATVLSPMDVWIASDVNSFGANTMGDRVRAYLDAKVSDRLPTASYTAPPSAATIAGQVTTDHGVGSYVDSGLPSVPTVEEIRTEMDDNSNKLANLDDTITSRLADADYAAPPLASAIASAVLDEAAAGHTGMLALIYKILKNKTITDPDTSLMTVYDDDDATPLFTATIRQDAAGTEDYNDQGIDYRERLT